MKKKILSMMLISMTIMCVSCGNKSVPDDTTKLTEETKAVSEETQIEEQDKEQSNDTEDTPTEKDGTETENLEDTNSEETVENDKYSTVDLVDLTSFFSYGEVGKVTFEGILAIFNSEVDYENIPSPDDFAIVGPLETVDTDEKYGVVINGEDFGECHQNIPPERYSYSISRSSNGVRYSVRSIHIKNTQIYDLFVMKVHYSYSSREEQDAEFYEFVNEVIAVCGGEVEENSNGNLHYNVKFDGINISVFSAKDGLRINFDTYGS